jgi:hypothetical protein
VATFQTTPRFDRDWKRLTYAERARFLKVVTNQFSPDVDSGQFRVQLRVETVKGHSGVWEMT